VGLASWYMGGYLLACWVLQFSPVFWH